MATRDGSDTCPATEAASPNGALIAGRDPQEVLTAR
jgi:hypothetical protein